MLGKTETSITTIKIKRMIITFQAIRINDFNIPKFRGYLAERYSDYDLIHNHLNNNRLRYAYPAIQFKTINAHPVIVGIGEGIDILKKVFMDIDKLNIDGHIQRIDEKSIILEKVVLGQTDRMNQYRFISPWMALNSENHRKYKTLEWHQRRKFLEIILARNLKSLSKGLGYFIPDFPNVHVQAELKPVKRNFKNIKMTCFQGTFATNFMIPDHLGIGKQTARGFGTAERLGIHE